MTLPAGYSRAPNGFVYYLDGSGPYVVDRNGNVVATDATGDFLTDIGFGLNFNYRRVTALGANPDVDIASLPEDVWTGGGAYPWMTGSTALEVVSSSAADAAAGTGARSVLIQGLDIDYLEVSQTVALNGITPVAIPISLFRVNTAMIMSAGTGKVNAGDISIRDTGGGTVRAILPAGYGITRQSSFTVPAGNTLQILSQFFGFNEVAGGNKFARFATFIQSSAGVYRMPLELAIGDEPPYRHDGSPGLTIPEKTDFCHRCTAISNDNSSVTAAWLGIMRVNGVVS